MILGFMICARACLRLDPIPCVPDGARAQANLNLLYFVMIPSYSSGVISPSAKRLFAISTGFSIPNPLLGFFIIYKKNPMKTRRVTHNTPQPMPQPVLLPPKLQQDMPKPVKPTNIKW